MIIKHSFAIVLSLSLAACATQPELVKIRNEMNDLRAEIKGHGPDVPGLQKRLATMEENIKGTVDVQKTVADYGAKMDQLGTDIQLLQGKLEENNFRIAELAQKLDDKSFKITEYSAKIDELEAKIKLLSGGASAISTGQTGTAKTTEPSEAYRQAKSDLDKGNYDLALAGFQNYVAQFPDTSKVDSAQYWIGECYYAKKEFGKARDAFAKVIKSYPKSNMVAGAKLKIGFSYENEKKNSKAREYLNRVIKEHPSTNEAKLAKQRLKKIKQ